jgi:hypothetical protein
VVLIFQVNVVSVKLALLARLILMLPISTPVAAAGAMKAGTPAPPLATEFNAPPGMPEPAAAALTAPAGMLPPAPLVKAAALFGTHAQTLTWVRPRLKAQTVRIVVVVLPGLAAVLGESAKLTVAPAVTVTLTDSVNVAFRTTVPAFEFLCAFAGGETAAESAMPPASASNLWKFFMKPLVSNVEGNAKSHSVFESYAQRSFSASTGTAH